MSLPHRFVPPLAARLGLHPAWIAAAAAFIALLTSAGIRSMPGVLLVPLEQDLGWSRATISFAVSVGIALYGLVGPFAAALMQRFGIRRCLLLSLLALSLSVGATSQMSAPWHMLLSWGLMTGLATGMVANVLGVTIVNRWFVRHRGLAMGLLSASVATGQLAFLPLLALLIEQAGWRLASGTAAIVILLMMIPVALLLPESPGSLGLRALGAESDPPPPPAGNPFMRPFTALRRWCLDPTFLLLFASFFVCGLSTNGLVGTHLIAFCLDHGIPEIRAAGLLAAMGLLDLVGTTASGWLSDRFNNRLLLAWYYGLRGLSLIALPFSDFSVVELSFFALFYGLDWIATVPPTMRLSTARFGLNDAPLLFGWIAAGHQLGAACAAWGGGLLRVTLETYLHAFIVAGAACLLIAGAFIISGLKQRQL